MATLSYVLMDLAQMEILRDFDRRIRALEAQMSQLSASLVAQKTSQAGDESRSALDRGVRIYTKEELLFIRERMTGARHHLVSPSSQKVKANPRDTKSKMSKPRSRNGVGNAASKGGNRSGSRSGSSSSSNGDAVASSDEGGRRALGERCPGPKKMEDLVLHSSTDRHHDSDLTSEAITAVVTPPAPNSATHPSTPSIARISEANGPISSARVAESTGEIFVRREEKFGYVVEDYWPDEYAATAMGAAASSLAEDK